MFNIFHDNIGKEMVSYVVSLILDFNVYMRSALARSLSFGSCHATSWVFKEILDDKD